MRRLTLQTLFLACICFFGFHTSSYATHLAGGEITYECLGNNQYEVTLTLYRDCDGIEVDSTYFLTYTSDACAITDTLEVFPDGPPTVLGMTCSTAPTTCDGGTSPGIQKYTYSSILTLPSGCSEWVIGFVDCCRNSAINTANSNGFNLELYFEATIQTDNQLCNNSPTFMNDPVLFLCQGQAFNYNHGAFDADGDSLAYSLVTPREDRFVDVNYFPPYSATNPIASSPALTLDAGTGALAMTPTQAGQVTILAVQVDEYRNGQLIGSIIRDLQVWVTSSCANTLPTTSGIDGTGVFSTSVCAGTNLCFDIPSNDADSGQTVTMTWDDNIAGATFSASGSPFETGTFCWTPSDADAGSNVFTVTVTDDACPMNGVQVYTFAVLVEGAFDISDDVMFCPGDTVTLSTTGGTSTTWSANGSVIGTGASISVMPTATTTYTADITDGNCTGTLSVTATLDNCDPPVNDCDDLNLAAMYSYSADELDVDFTDMSTGSASMVEWDFGDGTTMGALPGDMVSHTYAAPGTYTVCVKAIGWVGNICCHDLYCMDITVTEDPCADFEASIHKMYLGNSRYLFSDGTQPFATYVLWDFGDGTQAVTSGGASIQHSFTPGTYDVCITAVSEINDSICCVTTACKTIRVRGCIRGNTGNHTGIGISPGNCGGGRGCSLRIGFNTEESTDVPFEVMPMDESFAAEVMGMLNTHYVSDELIAEFERGLAGSEASQTVRMTDLGEHVPVAIEVYNLNGQVVQRMDVTGYEDVEMGIEGLDRGVYILKIRSVDFVDTHKFFKD